jgi:hypothetical protein
LCDSFFEIRALKQLAASCRAWITNEKGMDDMKMKASWMLAGALATGVLLSGCVVEPARPPQPAPVAEVAPPPPAQGYRWVKGHYRWEGNHWEWVPGHWRPV